MFYLYSLLRGLYNEKKFTIFNFGFAVPVDRD